MPGIAYKFEYQNILTFEDNFRFIGEFVENKAKGRISKRAFQESKSRQNFRKVKISYPLILTRTSKNRFYIHRFLSKVIISLPTNAEAVEVSEKALIGRFS